MQYPALLALVAATLIPLPATVPAQEPAVRAAITKGQPAPAVAAAKWLGGSDPFAGATAPWGGKAAMLVFWAPWCGSCVAEFPHVNELVAATVDQPLSIVSITSDPEAKVAALLEKRPLHSHKALDDDGKTFAAYGVRVLPRVVLVDARGNIAATPSLTDVDVNVLRRLANGEEVVLADAGQQAADLEWDEGKGSFDASTSLAHVIIERSTASSGGVRMPPKTGRITADGVGFANLIQIAFGAEPHEVRATHPAYRDFEQRYRVSVKAPDDDPVTARTMLREQLERAFAYRAEWIEVEEKTPILRCTEGVPQGSLRRAVDTKSGGSARSGTVTLQKVPMAEIADAIGSFAFGKRMLDETELDGDWDIDLQWTPGDKESLVQALAACGLHYVSEPRRLRKLDVAERQ